MAHNLGDQHGFDSVAVHYDAEIDIRELIQAGNDAVAQQVVGFDDIVGQNAHSHGRADADQYLRNGAPYFDRDRAIRKTFLQYIRNRALEFQKSIDGLVVQPWITQSIYEHG